MNKKIIVLPITSRDNETILTVRSLRKQSVHQKFSKFFNLKLLFSEVYLFTLTSHAK